VVNTRRVRVSIQHKSRYVYPRPALLGPQTIRLRPAEHARARIESYSLAIAPEHRLHWQRDPHGNHIARVTFNDELDITVELAVDEINPASTSAWTPELETLAEPGAGAARDSASAARSRSAAIARGSRRASLSGADTSCSSPTRA
jgi:hypothetical protein